MQIQVHLINCMYSALSLPWGIRVLVLCPIGLLGIVGFIVGVFMMSVFWLFMYQELYQEKFHQLC